MKPPDGNVDDRHASEFVGFSNAYASLDPSGHPHGESVGIVVSPGAFGIFGSRLAPEFSPPDHQRFAPAILFA